MQQIITRPRLSIPEILTFSYEGRKIFLDIYHFAKYTLGYEKLGDEHKLWAQRLEQAVNYQRLRKLVMLKPRGTFKTTFYTIALPLWLHLQNPNLRILLANAVDDNAKKFLSEITSHYLRNDRLAWLYQKAYGLDGCPIDPNKALMTNLRLTNCTRIQKEPNLATIGYGSSIVSQHFDVIIVDDLCDRRDRESATIREDKKRWFSDLASLLEPDGLLLIIGTRWHFNDVYSYVINELNPKHALQDK